MCQARLIGDFISRPCPSIEVATGVVLICLLMAASQAGAVVLNYYRFENGTPGLAAMGNGEILDSVGMDDGTPAGMPLYSADTAGTMVPGTGEPNGVSLSFDGVDDTLAFTQANPLNHPGDATLEFSINPDDVVGDAFVFYTRLDALDLARFNVFIRNGFLVVDYREDNGPPGSLHGVGSAPIEAGVWTHFAIVRSGADYLIYDNGELVSLDTDASPELPGGAGWRASQTDREPLVGLLDEIRVSDEALPVELLLYNDFLFADGFE